MASAKSVEDMLLCSDIDAVNALVGSLESQLSQPAAPYARTESTPNSVITNPSFADANFRTLSSSQKHGALLGSLLDRGNTNSNKTYVASQPVVMSPVPVMVSGSGPPSTGGFANNTYGQSPQQTMLNPPAVSNAEMKVVYSIHSASNLAPTVSTGVANNTQFARTNIKLQNGNPIASNTAIVMTSGLVRNGPTVVCQNSTVNLNSPAIPSQAPLVNASPGTFQSSIPQQHQNHPSQPVNSKSLSATNAGKPASVKESHVQQNSPQPTNFIQVPQTISNPQPVSIQNVNSQQTVISTSKCNPGTPVNVMTQVMTNQHPLQGIQVVNVNPTRFASTVQRTLAPRVVIGNQIRIAPQMIRHGVPVPIPGQNAIAIPPGLRGTIYVKTDNGQYQVLNIGPGMQSTVTPSSGTTAYRLQSVHPNSPAGIRTLVPQQIATQTSGAKSVQINSRTASPQTISSSIIKQAVPIASMSTSGVVPRVGSPLQAPAQASTAKMSSEAVKQKCRNFLSTLVRLVAEQPKKVAANVKKLIQGLIDGTVLPEEFTTRLQMELNSSPQPCLVPFLKKSLPYLRHSLITKEVAIEGVNPPPASAYMMPTYSAAAQLNQVRPVVTQPTVSATSVASTVGSVLTAQLSQPTGVLQNRMIKTQPRLLQSVSSHGIPRVAVAANVQAVASKPIAGVSSSAAMAFTSLPKISPTKPSVMKTTSMIKDKRTPAPVRDEDDINDVAAMGGVNLIEESQKILATNSELIGAQIRSCKDDNYVLGGSLQNKILHLVRKQNLQEVSSEAIALISHATQERLKTLVERLGLVAEHRTENVKNDTRYEVSQDVRSQVKFLEELDRLEKKKHEEQEREILLRAAKSRSKLEDPEQLKLKQKAKEMQKAEIEELRQREANMTALLAIGPRKKLKTDPGASGSSPLGLGNSSGGSNSFTKPMVRPRVKRVNFRDLIYVMEQDRDPSFKTFLYKSYIK